MKRFVLISLLFLAGLTMTLPGCAIFHKHQHKDKQPKQPKPSLRIASDVEQSFKDRWIVQRTAELQANKKAANEDDAKRMAADEFDKRYPYLSISPETNFMTPTPEPATTSGTTPATTSGTAQ
jgi:hypothetical protein